MALRSLAVSLMIKLKQSSPLTPIAKKDSLRSSWIVNTNNYPKMPQNARIVAPVFKVGIKR